MRPLGAGWSKTFEKLSKQLGVHDICDVVAEEDSKVYRHRLGIFEKKDGRYIIVRASSDGIGIITTPDKDYLIRHCLSRRERQRLKLVLKEDSEPQLLVPWCDIAEDPENN